MRKVAKLRIKVVPGASRSALGGWLGEMLKVRVAAPPEKGKANDAVVKLLAAELQVPASVISIASGKTSQEKTIEIKGVTTSAILQKLGAKSA